MKLRNLTFGIATAALVFVVGCSAATKSVSEEEIGLRTTTLYTEDKTVADKTQYGTAPAGTSTKFERAYENAPPMIPHDIEGLLPITIDNNQCLGCHEPAVAESMGATPIPKSHFTDLRPVTELNKDGKIVKEGKVVENTSDIKTVSLKSGETLIGARFNCSQCHAPQSQGNNVPKNDFKADFRTQGSNSKSNLIDTLNEGVK